MSGVVWVFIEVGVPQRVAVGDMASKHIIQSFWFLIREVVQLKNDKFMSGVRI